MRQDGEFQTEYPKFEITAGTQLLNTKYNPADLIVGTCYIPKPSYDTSVLGRIEYDDLAARIIGICQHQGEFVAPSFHSIGEQITKEIKETYKIEAAEREEETKEQVRIIMQSIKNGLSNSVDIKIVEPSEEEDMSGDVPFSVITCLCRFNQQVLADEIRKMINEGYLNLVSKDGNEFLEPTERLVEDILAIQKVTEGSDS